MIGDLAGDCDGGGERVDGRTGAVRVVVGHGVEGVCGCGREGLKGGLDDAVVVGLDVDRVPVVAWVVAVSAAGGRSRSVMVNGPPVGFAADRRTTMNAHDR